MTYGASDTCPGGQSERNNYRWRYCLDPIDNNIGASSNPYDTHEDFRFIGQ